MILLDTCALLWLAEGSPRISEEVRERIDAEPIVSVSAISALEIGLKTRSGKRREPSSLWAVGNAQGIPDK